MKKGFTLIELLLVIIIIAIIGTASAPMYSRYIIQNSVNLSRDQLIGQIRKAQAYALSGKQDSAWGIRYGSNTITLFKGNTYATRTTAFDENVGINPNLTISGLSEVVFAKITGVPNPTSATITITGNNITKTITINSMGVVNEL